MKKTFLAKRNIFPSSANISWGRFALACALLVFLLRLAAPNLFLQIFAPIFRAANAFAAENHAFIAGFENSVTLALRNEQLASENAILANENQILSQKISGISGLTGSSAPQQNTPGIIAGVLAAPPESPYDTLVLAAGSRAGVTSGMEAYGAGGVPLGVVREVVDGFSRVTLFSAPGMSTRGWVGRANVPLTIVGEGAGAMKATLARSAGITVGNTVFIPGPGMLPIGSVTRIDSDPSSPSVTLRILPLLNPFSVTWVTLRDTGTRFFGPLPSATSTLP